MNASAPTGQADAEGGEVAAIVLGQISRLLVELDPRSPSALTLDSDLSGDLGVDSLALIELIDRLEGALGVALPDDVMASATTPRDWLDAARAARGETPAPPRNPAPRPGAEPPVEEFPAAGASGSRRETGSTFYRRYSGLVVGGAVVAAFVVAGPPLTDRVRAALARSLVRVTYRLLGIRLRVVGRFPPSGAYVVVANHASFLDAPTLYAALPVPPVFVASVEIERTKHLGTLVGRFGAIFVQRGRPRHRTADDQLIDVARRGRCLVVFPEGSLSAAEGIRPFRLGAFDAACLAGLPVVPVGVRGTRRILTPGTRLLRPGTIEVVVGSSLNPSGPAFPDKVALRDAARREVARLSGEEMTSAG